MNTQQILGHALQLKPNERFSVINTLLESLDQPDKDIDEIWAIEAQKRLIAYRKGNLRGIDMRQIFIEE